MSESRYELFEMLGRNDYATVYAGHDMNTDRYATDHPADRDRVKGERFPLEFLVRKLSSDTAQAYGLHDRGQLTPGYLADLNVIDFGRLRLHRPEAITDLPAGGKRLVQRVEGYRYTVKSGQVTFENGTSTGALPGSLVRGGREARIL